MNGQLGVQPFASLLASADMTVHGEYDVIVFGGGAAGCTAAIQAARTGKRTALVEKNGVLGGTTIVASVNFPGLFHAWGKQVIRGIGWEIIERTAKLGGAKLPDFTVVPERHWKHQILVNRFIYSAVLDQMCLEAGVHIRLHEMPAGIVQQNGATYAAIVGKGGLRWFKAGKLVDATGDADVVGMMGYARKKGEVLQPGTLINDIGGYDLNVVDEEQLGLLNEEARREDDERRSRNGLYSDLKAGRISMHVQGIDGSDSESKTQGELKARRMLLEAVTLLRRAPGCENLEVRYFANECGIRETWRIEGEAEVDEQSYVSGYVWPDAVCHSFYPIDLHHHSGYHIVQQYLQPGIVPTIPYRALIPRGSDDRAGRRHGCGDRLRSAAIRPQRAAGCAAGAASPAWRDRSELRLIRWPLSVIRQK
ncbi:MAG: FAD-dependent oxidoreductase [Paenibacillus sp.]|nr:FAD-dependent oxidoreductase [Paenibacillus sp.]